MTQGRRVQQNSFPGYQKHSPGIAGSELPTAPEAGDERWEEQTGSWRGGKAQMGLQRGKSAFMKFGLTETEDKPRVSFSLLENKR